MKKIILAAGGTGGHFFPAIALGEELAKNGNKIYLITDHRCQKYLTSEMKLSAHIIDIKLDSKSLFGKIRSIFSIFTATVKSLILIYQIKADIIVGFGGYPSLPPMLAGILLRISLITHEQNCFVGKTNLFLMKFVKIAAYSYPETISNITNYRNKIIVTGDIVRENIRNISIHAQFEHNPFRILVIGGSQGAKIFSTLIPEALRLVAKTNQNIHVVQQVSSDDYHILHETYKKLGISYQLSDFFYDIEKYYSNSELLIARAGAGTIAEITNIGLPCILIPYPYAAENHQFHNAKAIHDADAGWCFEQQSITTELLACKIIELINDRTILKKASINLLKRKRNGCAIMADTVTKIING